LATAAARLGRQKPPNRRPREDVGEDVGKVGSEGSMIHSPDEVGF